MPPVPNATRPPGNPDRGAARGEGGLAGKRRRAVRDRELAPGRATVGGGEDEKATVERVAEGDAAAVVPEVEAVEEALRALVAVDRAPTRAAVGGREDARRRADRERQRAAVVEALDVTEVARRELGRRAGFETARAVGRERDSAASAAHPDDAVVDYREAAQRDILAELRDDQSRLACDHRVRCAAGAGAPVATMAASATKRPVKEKRALGIIV